MKMGGKSTQKNISCNSICIFSAPLKSKQFGKVFHCAGWRPEVFFHDSWCSAFCSRFSPTAQTLLIYFATKLLEFYIFCISIFIYVIFFFLFYCRHLKNCISNIQAFSQQKKLVRMLPELSMDSLLQNVSWFKSKYCKTSGTATIHFVLTMTACNTQCRTRPKYHFVKHYLNY